MSSCHNYNQTNNIKEGVKDNKIRKRNCSSSSSSSLARKYRFKRAILVGKKGGTTTPVPLWKTSANSSPSMDTTTEQILHSSASGLPFKDKEKEVSVSARKLAATLWEMNDLIPSMVKKEFEVDQMRTCKETSMKSREKAVSLSRSGLLRSLISDPCNSPTTERMKGFESDGYRRTVSGLSHPHRSGVDAHMSSSFIEENCYKNKDGVKSRLKEARSGLSTSKKILKVLNKMCHREKQSSTMALVMALGSELERVCGQVDKLVQEERSNSNQINAEYMVKRFEEEKAALKMREREKVHDAIKNVSEELKVEKKLRKQTERLNKKIAIEMASVKASHMELCKELEREKRAKEILEQVCDELARGIGEDRAHVEELKKESVKVLEEVEKEREMLQLADILREERVQMKLSEAKYQFEEKNDFLEKLRNELEDFMRTRDEENGDVSPESTKFNDLETYFNTICHGIRNAEKVNDSDDDGSDLVSIELNMNNNDNRGYDWSYTNEKDAQNDPKRVSTDKDSTGRKSFSERIQWGSICFNKRNSSFKKRDLEINIQKVCDHSDPDTSVEFLSRARIQDDKEGTPSNRSISGANPVQRRDQLLTLQSNNEEAEENILLAFEGDNLKQEAEVKKPRCYLKSFDSDG
ncbi:unnamed protein product [Vicia faba]|uniref:Uncharacterized protein n=1 Tax=Vicia faba TaxID=3906 RepID=A0AAV1B120_VICFA|nr:unnamed protein product [Vicia faba]